MLYNNQGVLELFDSLGVRPEYIRDNFAFDCEYEFNETPVQCTKSHLCGAFVLYFIIYRHYNLDMSFEDFMNHSFTANCTENEKEVVDFLKTL